MTNEDVSSDELCGLGSWRPAWLQKLANHHIFTCVFLLNGIIQGMMHSYFTGTLTTIEKAFGIQSSVLGVILSGNDISQILCGLVITYIGGRGSRPFWFAIGMLMTATSCFMYASIQFLWDGNATPDSLNTQLSSNYEKQCYPNSTYDLPQKSSSDICQSDSTDIFVLVILFVGQFVYGTGSTTLYTLGFPYLDDSVKKSASPLYTGMTSAVRTLGPFLGYVVASLFLKIYIVPGRDPGYTARDPRWLGAWWLGFLAIGSGMILCACPIIFFPKRLPKQQDNDANKNLPKSEHEKEQELEDDEMPSVKDFRATIRRVGKNPLIILHLLSIGPLFLGVVGYSTFLPKYMEAQFGQSASQASIFSGAAGMLMMMIGVAIGGLIIWKFQPSAFWVCMATVFANILFAIGMFVIMNLQCSPVHFEGVSFESGGFELTSNCSRNCNCDKAFDPVCVNSKNYLSPCMAGCRVGLSPRNNKISFLNCSCALDFINDTLVSLPENATDSTTGYCPESRDSCGNFMPYTVVLGALKLIVAASRAGGILVLIRSVARQDKGVALSLSTNVASLIGFIPGPIIYGALIDKTCLLWATTPCGKRGNCWIYDLDSLRFLYHGITIGCFVVSSVFEIFLAIFARQLNLYGDDPPSRVLNIKEGLQCRGKQQTSVSSGLEIIKSRY